MSKLGKVIVLDAVRGGGTLSDEAGALMLAAVRAFIAGDDSDPFRVELAASARLLDLDAMEKKHCYISNPLPRDTWGQGFNAALVEIAKEAKP